MKLSRVLENTDGQHTQARLRDDSSINHVGTDEDSNEHEQAKCHWNPTMSVSKKKTRDRVNLMLIRLNISEIKIIGLTAPVRSNPKHSTARGTSAERDRGHGTDDFPPWGGDPSSSPLPPSLRKTGTPPQLAPVQESSTRKLWGTALALLERGQYDLRAGQLSAGGGRRPSPRSHTLRSVKLRKTTGSCDGR